MRAAVLWLVCAAGTLMAQQDAQVQHRLGLVATRAIACFRVADSIEANLRTRGMTMNADLAILRARLEATLDETDAAITKNDLAAASAALDRAQALLDKFAARLGG